MGGFVWAGEIVILTNSEYDPSVHLSYGNAKMNKVLAPWYTECVAGRFLLTCALFFNHI